MGFWSSENTGGEQEPSEIPTSNSKNKRTISNQSSEGRRKKKRLNEMEEGNPTNGETNSTPEFTLMANSPSDQNQPKKPRSPTMTERIVRVLNQQDHRRDGLTELGLRTILSGQMRSFDNDKLKMALDKAVKQGKLEYFRRRYMVANSSTRGHSAPVTKAAVVAKTVGMRHVRIPKGNEAILTRVTFGGASKIKMNSKAKPESRKNAIKNGASVGQKEENEELSAANDRSKKDPPVTSRKASPTSKLVRK